MLSDYIIDKDNQEQVQPVSANLFLMNDGNPIIMTGSFIVWNPSCNHWTQDIRGGWPEET